MARPKGQKKLGGRVKGTPNKATAEAREAIKNLLDGNAHRVEGWLDAIAEKDPKAAIAAFTALLEFGVPKLQRTELTGKDGGAIVVQASKEDETL